MSLEDMGACSSNEKYNRYPMEKFLCLIIRFEQTINDRLSIDKSSQGDILITPND